MDTNTPEGLREIGRIVITLNIDEETGELIHGVKGEGELSESCIQALGAVEMARLQIARDYYSEDD
ncbi:hypothetical protein [Mobiluncus curtisii]|uniref:Uncharacterized protein n=1 Tax=Mobiluncus curtisii ATCC 51333 TaxID=887326 RepID=E6M124_9ACTO|nr:hypothetical protein [Mobiluncus curtisii]EFU79654.1 hypothetical protein HMPREF0388_1757 [Mobiluncus curtisii ATCC 51333]